MWAIYNDKWCGVTIRCLFLVYIRIKLSELIVRNNNNNNCFNNISELKIQNDGTIYMTTLVKTL